MICVLIMLYYGVEISEGARLDGLGLINLFRDLELITTQEYTK